jgi:DNA-binding response OmpR family regulator
MKNRIPVRTLVIDDDQALCRKLHGWLTTAEFDVTTFTDPSDGLRYASANPCQLALVDLRMPQVDGSEVIASLLSAAPQTRVVAMAAFPETEQMIAAARAGARDLLEKPIHESVLLAALDRQLAEVGIAARTEAEFNRRLGARLRSLRMDAGCRLNAVATAVGITSAQLSQIELGKTATSTWTLARICGALQTPPASAFTDL